MSQISPLMVKDLREKTGAGMGDCKQALTEANGDMNAAIELLRKKGAASVAKRADKSANEGLVVAKTTEDGKTGVIVEINCETDFVAKNEEFVNYVNTVVDAYLNNSASSTDELMAIKIGNDSVNGIHNEILAKFAEKIEIRRFNKINSDGYISSYNHAGSKLAVLVGINTQINDDQTKSLVRDISMQIAAMKPLFIDRTMVDQTTLNKEIEIYKEAAIQEGKKPEIAERIAHGRLEKYYQENCLIEQVFVKDQNKTIGDVLKEITKNTGSEVKVVSFLRFYLGEEILPL